MRKFCFLLCIFLFCRAAVAQDASLYLWGAVLEGPYKTNIVENAELSIVKTGNTDYPLSLVLDVKNIDGVSVRQLVDKYDVAGSLPKIESIFFYPIQDVKSAFVLVSWEINHRGIGTYGTLYQVYAYARHGSGKLIPNQLIQANRYLSGIDGVSDGVPQKFAYKDAASIKAYVKKHLNTL
ncbi:hypothetical protein [Pseudomonas mandelii]|uniref:hypothetical protein n=1 Tax=Pseudomonas mandelii TaxID=75612 RepID=UPI0020A0FDB0|nr:hypothetical protein [Pseudomonas mandelii]MCO8309941.1 hypothetical protein [Pseudomonas mandelii]